MFDKVRALIEEQKAKLKRHENQAKLRVQEVYGDDPLIDQVDWFPLVRGGSNFQTRVLKQAHADRLTFEATKRAKLFALIFMIIGGFVASLGLFVREVQELGIFFLLFGGVFLIAGIFVWKHFTKAIVFDKVLGFYWKGTQRPIENTKNGAIRLQDIHAIQLISEYLVSNSSSSSGRRRRNHSYYSYEINLVLESGERINVIDHGDKMSVRRDANQLADFIGVPVWDSL